jgi:AraC-like DNA-binding protein
MFDCFLDVGRPDAVPESILVTRAVNGHDRATAAADPVTAALHGLRLDGAIFFRAEFTERWAYQSATTEQMVDILHPGAARLIIFHIVAAGRSWVQTEGGERLWADTGEVIVVPYGDQHSMGGDQAADEVPILNLIDPPPWARLPVLRHGAGGERTDVVCGYLHSDHPLFNPALRALPPVFVVHPPDGLTANWIRSSIEYALQISEGQGPTAKKLPELVLRETLRLHLATAPAIATGWLAALSDPVLAPAMARLHGAPERHWTVQQLATSVAVSRSVLDERFRQVLGRSPIRYLTDWRMHLAEELLLSTGQSLAAIARRVGYDSEEAFSRAFKRTHTLAPGAWRQNRR